MRSDRESEGTSDEGTVSTATMGEGAGIPPLFFELVVLEGPDQDASWVLDHAMPPMVFLGQGEGCALRLSDPHVSRRHACISFEAGALRLVDMDSTNGTHVNGVSIREATLRGSEIITVGGTRLRVGMVRSRSSVPLSGATGFGRVLGTSAAMRRLYPIAERLAASRIPVVIEGETGTGKEVMAEALHQKSPRVNKPFVVFDCTAVPANLLEAALFGHHRGAFTGAVESREGVFEQAHGGTLLLDEIGDLELPLQAKLLRAIERAEVRRVGGDKWIHVDVRILAATRRNLEREVSAGRFRDDLFYRLAVGRIELPPLRLRHGDIPYLAHVFWRGLGMEEPLSARDIQLLEDYSWPGNVRELYNTLARKSALRELAGESPAAATSMESGVRPLPSADTDWMDAILARGLPLPRARALIVEEFERRYVQRVLVETDGNIRKAAQNAGVAHRYFQLLRARQR